MDNSADLSTRTWSTPRGAGIAMAVGGVILIVGAALTAADPVGLVLLGLAGLLLLAFAAYALLVRPRLALAARADGPAVIVRTLRGSHVYPQVRVHRVRVLDFRRIGRRSGQLELEILPAGAMPSATPDELRDDTRLIVFGRWDLGADVGEVADELARAGFAVENRRR
ncbi:PH domain-containing protein [Gordonia sp. CPCC 206044]|uniref:PH domain-containing protein n=1 Tax=Gordonia sp. CPCC 206044 TaxID=3140793 RepID=UPI003AF38A6A